MADLPSAFELGPWELGDMELPSFTSGKLELPALESADLGLLFNSVNSTTSTTSATSVSGCILDSSLSEHRDLLQQEGRLENASGAPQLQRKVSNKKRGSKRTETRKQRNRDAQKRFRDRQKERHNELLQEMEQLKDLVQMLQTEKAALEERIKRSHCQI